MLKWSKPQNTDPVEWVVGTVLFYYCEYACAISEEVAQKLRKDIVDALKSAS